MTAVDRQVAIGGVEIIHHTKTVAITVAGSIGGLKPRWRWCSIRSEDAFGE